MISKDVKKTDCLWRTKKRTCRSSLRRFKRKKLKRGCQHPSHKFEILWRVAQNWISLLLSYFVAQYGGGKPEICSKTQIFVFLRICSFRYLILLWKNNLLFIYIIFTFLSDLKIPALANYVFTMATRKAFLWFMGSLGCFLAIMLQTGGIKWDTLCSLIWTVFLRIKIIMGYMNVSFSRMQHSVHTEQ